ncbi:MAG: metallophosphoesterase family protein [Armatimonadetes bacterium]|nr:metallophosphoesterase family protein [Armatimonadota bacterium]
MRVGIFGDIHGNAYAFEQAISDMKAQRLDQMVCLGDAIQGGPQPSECVALLRELACPIVLGNADDFMLTLKDDGSDGPIDQRTLDIREWQMEQLSPPDREFIQNFQPTVNLDLGGEQLLCFHGSPASYNGVLLPTSTNEEFEEKLGGYPQMFFTGGHTHVQQIRRIKQKVFINPGSVGFAYSHMQDMENFRADPWAEYAILTFNHGQFSIEFRRIPYEAAKVREIILKSGAPHAENSARRFESL